MVFAVTPDAWLPLAASVSMIKSPLLLWASMHVKGPSWDSDKINCCVVRGEEISQDAEPLNLYTVFLKKEHLYPVIYFTSS